MKSNLCLNDLIVLHSLGIFFVFLFLVRKIPFAGIELTSQRVRGLRGTSELPGRPATVVDLLLIVGKKADSYGNEKLIRKWTRSVFFCFFFDLMGTRMVQIRIAKSV